MAECGVVAQSERHAEGEQAQAENGDPPPAEQRGEDESGRGDQQTGGQRAHDPASPRGQGMRNQRTGLVDETDPERPPLLARPQW